MRYSSTVLSPSWRMVTSGSPVRGGSCATECMLPSSKSAANPRSEEHTSELQSRPHLVCRLLLEKKKNRNLLSNFSDQSRFYRTYEEISGQVVTFLRIEKAVHGYLPEQIPNVRLFEVY